MYNIDIVNELRERWGRIYQLISLEGVKSMIVALPANLFYTSSRVFSGYVYFVEGQSEPVFFVKRPVGLEGDNVVYIRKPEDIIEHIGFVENIAMELDGLSYSEVLRLSKVFKDVKVVNGSQILRVARSVKSEYEQELIRLSGKKHSESYAELKNIYHKGISDVEFSIEAERVLRKHGSLGMFRIAGNSMEIFFGSVVAGDNADNPSPYDFAMGGEGQNSSLPVGANGTILKEGTTVMVDLGGNFTGYMTDMSRVFGVGELSELAYRAHEVSRQIVRKFESVAKEGVLASELYNMAYEMADSAGLLAYFMGYSQKAGFVGHGVGIEINEMPVIAPKSRDVLKSGMVVALEPKFVLPGIGAVGVENTYIIAKDRVEKVTNANEELVLFEKD